MVAYANVRGRKWGKERKGETEKAKWDEKISEIIVIYIDDEKYG